MTDHRTHRVQGLRQSGAAGPHGHRRPRGRELAEVLEQELGTPNPVLEEEEVSDDDDQA